jgi:hypothetical protein
MVTGIDEGSPGDKTKIMSMQEGFDDITTIYTSHEATNGHAYRPRPHVIHLGAPLGRAGALDASIPGAIYKNVWVSASPRPAFPE